MTPVKEIPGIAVRKRESSRSGRSYIEAAVRARSMRFGASLENSEKSCANGKEQNRNASSALSTMIDG